MGNHPLITPGILWLLPPIPPLWQGRDIDGGDAVRRVELCAGRQGRAVVNGIARVGGNTGR